MTWLGVKGIKKFPKMWPAPQTWKPYCMESEGLWLKRCMPSKSFDFNVLSRGCRGFSAPYMIDTSEPKICVVSKEITLGARWFDIEKATKPHFGHQQQGTNFFWNIEQWIQSFNILHTDYSSRPSLHPLSAALFLRSALCSSIWTIMQWEIHKFSRTMFSNSFHKWIEWYKQFATFFMSFGDKIILAPLFGSRIKLFSDI